MNKKAYYIRLKGLVISSFSVNYSVFDIIVFLAFTFEIGDNFIKALAKRDFRRPV
jgi:hypothetical protein